MLHTDCADSLLPYLPQCFKCGSTSQDYATCRPCRSVVRPEAVYATTHLKGVGRDLVQNYKFGQALAAKEPLARQMSAVLPGYMPGFVVVPVPTVASHVRTRGFDHSTRLARALAEEHGLPFADLLSRSGKAKQVGSSRKQRLAQLKGAFSVQPNAILPDKVLLVDDVATTGATLSECTKVLRRAGVKHVQAVVFAKS